MRVSRKIPTNKLGKHEICRSLQNRERKNCRTQKVTMKVVIEESWLQTADSVNLMPLKPGMLLSSKRLHIRLSSFTAPSYICILKYSH
ncbi:hypothetical protein BH18THE2_BH18THE2_21240 [soil metagenome]